MSEQLHRMLSRAAGDPDDAVDVADLRARLGRRRRRRFAAGGVGVLLVGLLAAGAVALVGGGSTSEVVLSDPDAGGVEPQTYPRPEPGEVAAIIAPDGEPSFLVGGKDTVRAFRAIEPMGGAMAELVVWCEPAQRFLAPLRGSTWNADGAYLSGPAPGDLIPYETEVDRDIVTVGHAQPRPDRIPDAAKPEAADSLKMCFLEPDSATPRPLDPDAVVVHAHPEQGAWPPVEQALTEATGPQTLSVRLALTGAGGESLRACTNPTGQPPTCPADAPVMGGLDPVDEELRWVVWQGYARVRTDGTALTGFDYWAAVTRHRAESRQAGCRDRERSQALDQLGPAGRIVVDNGRLTVPAVDFNYGEPPDEPIPAGTYELVLENHGRAEHTLVNRDLGIDLRAGSAPGRHTDRTDVELPPGTHTFYCRIPGHRKGGMEFDLTIERSYLTSAAGGQTVGLKLGCDLRFRR